MCGYIHPQAGIGQMTNGLIVSGHIFTFSWYLLIIRAKQRVVRMLQHWLHRQHQLSFNHRCIARYYKIIQYIEIIYVQSK